ncbi:hypothetical protein BMS3Bbin04_01287 [bacterium BMS3Bbin04]|nr:hypothetical protein BMS3Bbin04_01287 [bacterium BMS3Bbin04]
MNPRPDVPIPVTTILTHVHPDLDAVFCVYLLRHHGEELFPGAKDAGLQFASANELPDGKSSDQLEREGIIAVDTGGGRLDTHPVEGQKNSNKWDLCASELVAKAVGVEDDPRYRYLLPYANAHDARGQAMTSKSAIHHLLAPHGLIEGVHRLADSDTDVIDLMSCMVHGLAVAGGNDPDPINETAARFDRTLAWVLENGQFEAATIERKSPNEWPERGASHNVATVMGWTTRRDMEKMLTLAAQLLANGEQALPDVETERRILLTTALDGLAREYGEDSEEYRNAAMRLITAVIQREADWFNAIDEVERSAKVHRGRGLSMASIASKNGLTIKAARYRRGVQAVLYFNPETKAVTLQAGMRKDGSPLLNLERVTKRLRTAELIRRNENGIKLPKDVGRIGMFQGWFLHPSKRLLNRGSPKAPDVEPSALSWQEIIELVRTDLRPDDKMPDWFCPDDKCLEEKCTMHPLRFLNCKFHKERTATAPKAGTLGDLFADKLKKRR